MRFFEWEKADRKLIRLCVKKAVWWVILLNLKISVEVFNRFAYIYINLTFSASSKTFDL